MNRLLVAIAQTSASSLSFARHWIWLFAAVALLAGGFHYRILPASFSVTAYGTPLAALALSLACFFLMILAAIFGLVVASQVDPKRVVERTCLSSMLASMLCVLTCIGPNDDLFFEHGRYVRVALWFVSFGVLQLAWMRKWDLRLRARLPQFWREHDLIYWPDAILVALVAVFAAEMTTYFDRPYIQVTPFALVMNIALLAAAMVMAWAIVGRGLFAAALTVCGYFMLSFLNVMKLKHLSTGLQPGDQVYLSELFYYKSYFTPGLVGGACAAAAFALGVLIYAWRKSACRFSLAARGRMFAGALFAFIGVGIVPWLPGGENVLRHLGIVDSTWTSYASVKRNGLLCELAIQLPESYVARPAGYDLAAVAQILAERSTPAVTPAPVGENPIPGEEQPKINIVIFLFESWMEPHDLNRPFRREVIPNIRKLEAESVHGFAISPRRLGGSAESEFEVITGMSTGFLPSNSCAYKHFVKRPTPSLVSHLNADGYHTTALQVILSGFYNYREVYQHFGFDLFRSEEKLVRPKRILNANVISDETFVDEMLASLTRAKPAFVMGFNQASHAPYHAKTLLDQPRFLVEPSNPASDQIEVYLQKINRTDKQIGRLVQELKAYPEPVVLLLVGDHHPPFSADSHAYEIPAFHASGPAGELYRRRVPFVIWKNFQGSESADSASKLLPAIADETYVSMNFLSLLLLQAAEVEPQDIFAWNQQLLEECPVISRDLYYSQGQAKTWEELTPAVQSRIREYELLQYDILLGDNFADKIWQKAEGQSWEP